MGIVQEVFFYLLSDREMMVFVLSTQHLFCFVKKKLTLVRRSCFSVFFFAQFQFCGIVIQLFLIPKAPKRQHVGKTIKLTRPREQNIQLLLCGHTVSH